MSVTEAAALVRAGRLVAFPTETVYGLGANALDAAAVERIFEAKGRPRTSPLIVHVDSEEMARSLAREWPAAAAELARRYWPGPLTLVVKKDARIPDNVTAGLASYISRVATVGGTTATLRTGSPTASGGPAITLDGGTSGSVTIPGGSRQFTVNSTARPRR